MRLQSVTSTYVESEFKINIKDPEFALLVKAQFFVKSPRPKIVPQWSFSATVAALSEQRFVNEDSSLENLF